MGQKQTRVAERNHFIDLKLSGYTLQEIVKETGWTSGTSWRAVLRRMAVPSVSIKPKLHSLNEV